MEKIFIVEDDRWQRIDVVNGLKRLWFSEDEIDIAENLTEAEQFMWNIKEYVAIVLDYTLLPCGQSEDTLDLLRRIKESGYKWPIIAASGTEELRELMMEQWATDQISQEYKIEVVSVIERLLKEKRIKINKILVS